MHPVGTGLPGIMPAISLEAPLHCKDADQKSKKIKKIGTKNGKPETPPKAVPKNASHARPQNYAELNRFN